MSWKIGMPNLGHTMEEGKVAEWLKPLGAAVTKGETIALVESDKSTFDIEAPADGVLLAINVEAGETVLVGAQIGLVGLPGEAVSAPEQAQPAVAAHAATASSGEENPTRRRAKISPAARALAEELGVAIEAVTGTGDDGMITRDDIRGFQGATSPAPASTGRMRRAIAEATQRAWTTIPHVALFSHADVTAIVKPRRFGLTEAILRAAALALRDHAAFNGWWSQDGFTAAGSIDVALAVAAPDGLVMPVIRGADGKSIANIAAEIKAFAASARDGTLDGGKTTGASFSMSSLGRFGVDAFAPIISAPQVAILGVGGVDRRAREEASGGVIFRSEVSLSLVFDHRANDGAEAAALLAAIVANLQDIEKLERP